MGKIAKWDPEEMRQMLIKFVDRTDFDGTASTPSEAAFTVKLARYLPKIVEYQPATGIGEDSRVALEAHGFSDMSA